LDSRCNQTELMGTKGDPKVNFKFTIFNFLNELKINSLTSFCNYERDWSMVEVTKPNSFWEVCKGYSTPLLAGEGPT
jgi:hypothetical protein